MKLFKTAPPLSAKPLPAITLRARALGMLSFCCPTCHQHFPFQRVPWRRGLVKCFRCTSKFQLGVGLSVGETSTALQMGTWNSYCANALEPNGTPLPDIKFHGTIEWACPDCGLHQANMVDHKHCLTCTGCAAVLFASVLVYKLPKVSRLKVQAPHDSLFPVALHETSPVQPPQHPPTDSRAGAPSDRAGGAA